MYTSPSIGNKQKKSNTFVLLGVERDRGKRHLLGTVLTKISSSPNQKYFVLICRSLRSFKKNIKYITFLHHQSSNMHVVKQKE